MTPPRHRKPELRSLDATECIRFLRAAEGTDYDLPVHLALYTGLRRSEILGLRWGDVDLDARTLTVRRTMVSLPGDSAHISEPKSRVSCRVVSFGEQTENLLRRHQAPSRDSQVYARLDGTEMRPFGLYHGYGDIAGRCGIDVRFYDLRYTHASLPLADSVPVHVVQARLGHESIQTTVDVYGHVLPASDGAAGEVLERELTS